MMELSPDTISLLDDLERLARKPLPKRNDVGILLELARRSRLEQTLDDLAFYAKFCDKTYGIMQRIGVKAEGYAKLSDEFTANATKCSALLERIMEQAPDEVRERFAKEYLARTPEAFASLLSLFRDLSWYKNRQIDLRMDG